MTLYCKTVEHRPGEEWPWLKFWRGEDSPAEAAEYVAQRRKAGAHITLWHRADGVWIEEEGL